ncbi:MAG: recombination protein RecR [Candidatus Marinimicrobia bacterium]|nr:recombination protein RecR [Candidatus Neomarinimicrobiota bacterium]|tara:strand:- start:117 stop:710 length:594 start_codon:yes stop_codon:yes gene_type:complete
MHSLPDSAIKLIDELSRLPGIGRKTAQRLAFHFLNSDEEQSHSLSQSLLDIKIKIKNCSICHGITEKDPCKICNDPRKNDSFICVVENAYDIFVFEKTNSFSGKYHVLGGALSPLDGIGPDDLNIESLVNRIKDGFEVVIATNPSVEGETTALYLSKILGQKGVNVTKLARGVPVGSDLEYVDDATLIRAMEGRVSV